MTFALEVSRHRRRRPGQPPPGSLYVWGARTIPGNLIGVGRTAAEAVESARGLLEWTRDDEPSFEAWYGKAWRFAHPGDREHFDQQVADGAGLLQVPA